MRCCILGNCGSVGVVWTDWTELTFHDGKKGKVPGVLPFVGEYREPPQSACRKAKASEGSFRFLIPDSLVTADQCFPYFQPSGTKRSKRILNHSSSAPNPYTIDPITHTDPDELKQFIRELRAQNATLEAKMGKMKLDEKKRGDEAAAREAQWVERDDALLAMAKEKWESSVGRGVGAIAGVEDGGGGGGGSWEACVAKLPRRPARSDA